VAYGYDRASDAVIALAEAGGEPGYWTGTTIPLGERVSGWVAATHHSALNSDARLDVDDDKRADTAFRSTLSVAVTSDESLAGVLSLYAERVEAFEERHRRLLLSAAAVLTSASEWRSECAEVARVRIAVGHGS
jgi:putative methionine-R-sulfoxide reductase with GAF domain